MIWTIYTDGSQRAYIRAQPGAQTFGELFGVDLGQEGVRKLCRARELGTLRCLVPFFRAEVQPGALLAGQYVPVALDGGEVVTSGEQSHGDENQQ